MDVPVGKIVKEIIDNDPSLTVGGLADALSTTRRNLGYMFQKDSWDSNQLLLASKYVRRNLFELYSAKLNIEISKSSAGKSIVNEPALSYQESNYNLLITLSYSKDQIDSLPKFLRRLHALAEELQLKVK